MERRTLKTFATQTIKFFNQLIEYKLERIEEIEKNERKSWSNEVVENLEQEIYAIEALIEQFEMLYEKNRFRIPKDK